jgi:hypothetical protein
MKTIICEKTMMALISINPERNRGDYTTCHSFQQREPMRLQNGVPLLFANQRSPIAVMLQCAALTGCPSIGSVLA